MTDQYTPTTDEVREDFAFPWSPDQIGDRPARVAAFDRWLAAHDAQVRAEALREAAEWKREHNLGHSVWGDYLKRLAEEKYRAGGDDMVTIWLDDRADRIAETNQHERSADD